MHNIVGGTHVYFSIQVDQLYPTIHQLSNEWYPRGLQISLHIRSPGLQDYSEV